MHLICELFSQRVLLLRWIIRLFDKVELDTADVSVMLHPLHVEIY
jgi:hypothetical protein